MTLLYFFTIQKDLNVEFIFPERGHSFLPSDRAFGCAERKFRKELPKTLSTDYIKTLKDFGSVYEYGDNFVFTDFATIGNILTIKPNILKYQEPGEQRFVIMQFIIVTHMMTIGKS